MNAATKPTKFPKAAWTERWTISEGAQHPKDSIVFQLQQSASPGPDAMTFAEAAVSSGA